MVASTRNHPLAENAGFSHNSPGALEVAALRAKVTLPADHELNDLIRLFKLPAECKVIDAILIAGDADSGAALLFDVGLVDSVQDPTDTSDADAFFNDSNIGQAGGSARMSLATGWNVAIRPYDRLVQLQIATGAAGAQSAAVELIMLVSPKQANGYDSAVAIPT